MKNGEGETLLKLQDGTQLTPKISIACDGIKSPVARWMGFAEPKYVGHCAFCSHGSYPNGQPFEPQINYIYGKGIRAGLYPVSPTKVYWFVCFNSASPGPRITDPTVLRKQILELVRDWPSEFLNIIESTPDDDIIRTPFGDRWLWPTVSPPASTRYKYVLMMSAINRIH